MAEISSLARSALNHAKSDMQAQGVVSGIVAGVSGGVGSAPQAALDGALSKAREDGFACGSANAAALEDPLLARVLHSAQAVAGYDACLNKLTPAQRKESAVKAAAEWVLPGFASESSPLAGSVASAVGSQGAPQGAQAAGVEPGQVLPSRLDPSKNVGPWSCDKAREVALSIPYVQSGVYAKESITGKTVFCGDDLPMAKRLSEAAMAALTIAAPGARLGERSVERLLLDLGAEVAAPMVEGLGAKQKPSAAEPAPVESKPPEPSAEPESQSLGLPDVSPTPPKLEDVDLGAKLAARRELRAPQPQVSTAKSMSM